VARLSSEELLGEDGVDRGMSTERVARRVDAARRLQLRRVRKLNADLTTEEIKAHCGLDMAGRRLVAQARERLNLSARAIHRALRVARTIADLEASDAGNETGPVDSSISPAHLAEALQLRRAID
jgi:magnesium chelatase family protein